MTNVYYFILTLSWEGSIEFEALIHNRAGLRNEKHYKYFVLCIFPTFGVLLVPILLEEEG